MTYYDIAVENFIPNPPEPTSSLIRIKPLPGQGWDPFEVRVESDRSMLRDQFPLGTVFILKAKEMQRDGGKLFLYSYFSWPYLVIDRKEAMNLIKQGRLGKTPGAVHSGMANMRKLSNECYQRGVRVL